MDLNQTSEDNTEKAFGKALSKRPGFRSFSEAEGQVSAEELNAGVNNAATYLLPFYESGVNISNVAQEYMKPEEERDYDYIKSQFTEAGQSAAIEGGLLLMGGVAGKYGIKGIKTLADKVKQYEVNPDAVSTFGAGAIKKKTVEPLEIGINEALQDGKFLKRYDASIAADMTEKVKNATAGNTRANALINTAVPEGTKVGIRLNLNSKIPDMPKGLDKLQTLHKGSFSGKALSYLPFATVKNVVFSVNQTGRTGIASKIKGIDTPEAKNKFNAMSVDGEYVPNKNLLNSNEDLVEISFNPGVHHLFIDLKTGQAVRGAKEATVIGDRVFAKGVEYWKKTEAPKPVPTQTGVNIPSDVRYKFKKGGAVMDDQMQMAFMDEGGIADDGMDVDPVSGNEVPPGSLAEEVRDDIPAQLSEGEYVVPADVVRYYGVKFFEDLRDQAKMGLADMEANGRIGGEPVPAGGPINDEELSEQEMSAIRQMMTGMAEGGEVQNPYLQQQQLYSQPRPAPIDEKRNTTITGINPVENQMPMQSMASGGQVQGYQDSGDVTATPVEYAENKFNPSSQYGLGFSFMGQPQQTATNENTTSQAPQGQSFTVLYHPEYTTNGKSKTFYLPRDSAVYQEYLGMGYTKQMPMTGSVKTPTTDTPVTTDLTGSTVTTGSGSGSGGSKTTTPEKVDYSTYEPDELLEAFDQNRKTRIALTALGAVNPIIALFGQGATRMQEKDILAAMKTKDVKPPEDEGGIVDNITNFVSGLFGKDKNEIKNKLPPQTIGEFGKSTTREARNIKPSKNISDKRKGSGMGPSKVKSKLFPTASGVTRGYTSGAKPVRSETGASTSSAAKTSAKKSLEKAGFTPGTYKGGRAEGGLMNKKGKK